MTEKLDVLFRYSRGCALYILDRSTTPQPYDANYSRGIAVCK